MIGMNAGKCPAVIIKEPGLHSKPPTSTQHRPVRKVHTLVGLSFFSLAGALNKTIVTWRCHPSLVDPFANPAHPALCSWRLCSAEGLLDVTT